MAKPLSVVDSIRAIKASIAEHEAEIERLAAELEEAKSVLDEPSQASTHVESPYQQHLKRKRLIPLARVKRPIRENSSIGFAKRILQKLGGDMEAGVLAEMVTEMSGVKVNKATLVSGLARYVKAQDTFTRPKPGHYGLREHVVKQDLQEGGLEKASGQ